MSNVSMTPGSRPRRGVIGVLALLGAGALATGVVLAVDETTRTPEAAGAVELATFASCEDMAAWGAEALGLAGGTTSTTVGAASSDAAFDSVGGAMEGAASAPTAGDGVMRAAAGDEAAGGAAVADGTNVAVEGVDEVDLVDRLTEDVALVTTNGVLAVVDLAAGEVVARASVPYDAQVTYDAEAAVVWVVGSRQDGSGVLVERHAVTTASLQREGAWSTSGYLVDARRVGPELTVVAAEGFTVVDPGPIPIDPPVEEVPEVEEPPVQEAPPSSPTTAPAEPEVDPDGPVAEPGGPAVDPGPIDPDGPAVSGPAADAPAADAPAATEPAANEPAVTVPFADGPVACDTVLHPEGPADPSATLIVTLPATGDVAPVRSAEVVGSGQLVHVTTGSAYLATPQWDQDGPRTGIHRFDLATLTPTGSGTVEGTLLDDFSMSEHDGVLRVATTRSGGGCCFARPAPMPVVVDDGVAVARPASGDVVGPTAGDGADDVAEPEEGLNEVVVLDTEGALDEVGRTAPFGHPGETLHGIRFAGTTAYAVTFLQTDPFYVVDLSSPTDPRVVGEVELPGFSSYLHPLGGDLVVGFGPDGSGRASAKLFDVSDPTAPTVVDDLVLGDDSPVQYDHHAFVDRGDGRFAVPATTWSSTPESRVVVVDTGAGRLDVVEEHRAPTVDGVVRAIPVGDEGWALLGYDLITLLGPGGVRGTIGL